MSFHVVRDGCTICFHEILKMSDCNDIKPEASVDAQNQVCSVELELLYSSVLGGHNSRLRRVVRPFQESYF